MALSQKSRFRLHLELYPSMGVLLVGLILMSLQHTTLGFVVVVPSAIHVSRLTTEYRRRREPYTSRQKAILLATEVTADMVIILGLLVLAIRGQTALHWQVFGVISVSMLLALAWSYHKIYTDPSAPTNDEMKRGPAE